MAKKFSKKDQKVRIKKLRANYRFTYDYIPRLNEFIKNNLPKEHWKVHIETVYDGGSGKDQWSRDVREFSVGKVISFLVDNNMKFEFDSETVTEDDLNTLRAEYKARQVRLKEILKEKVDGLDTSDMDFSDIIIEPYNYQKQAIRFFELNDGNVILADQPGVGKSAPAFSYVHKHNLKALIICPSSLKLNWKNEIKKFIGKDSFIYKYNPPKRSRNVNYPKDDCQFHIINYESLDTYFKYEYKHKCKAPGCKFELINLDTGYKKCPHCKTPTSVKSRKSDVVYFEDKQKMVLDPEEYDVVILDECHYIKNPQAKRTAIVKKVFADVPRKILISGTPIKNRPYEFFSILNFIKPKEFNNAHEFGKRYGAGFQDKFGWKYDGASNLEELYERVQPFLLRRLKKDVLELPAKTFVNIPVELSAKQMNEYKKIEENVVEQLNGEDNDGEVKTKLQIILELKRYISEVKVKECMPIVQDMIDQGEKIVVFSEFRNTAEMIKEKFGDRAVLLHGGTPMEDRNNAVEAFQRKDDDVMVFSGTIGAAGVGLTLTRASNLIFIGSAWSPSDMEQAEDRVHRASTTSDKVTIMKLIVEDTIDEAIEELLYEKSMIVGKTLDNSTSKKEVETVGSGGSIIGDLIDRILNG